MGACTCDCFLCFSPVRLSLQIIMLPGTSAPSAPSATTLSAHDTPSLRDAQFEAGLNTRTQVMGEAFVQKAFDGANDYTRVMQEFISRNAWGSVWQRDGVDLKTRSLITVAMLTALGRAHELKGHVRGALNNGATPEELREVFLHATVYCGFPLAIDGFRTACEVIEAVNQEKNT
jgi:4-carboxymuconolactone decarboxylase